MLKNEFSMLKFFSINLTTFIIISLNYLGFRTSDGVLIKTNIIKSKFNLVV